MAENHNLSQEQMPSPNEPSAIPKTDIPVRNILPNINPLPMVVNCEFCKQHLPSIGNVIHEQVSYEIC